LAVTAAFIFAAVRHKIFLRLNGSDSYTRGRLGIATISASLETPGVVTMGYTASWTFATMLAFGFVAAILLGVL
jgi:hypothetical protein